MIVDPTHPLSKGLKLVDEIGKPVPGVFSFDTETKEVVAFMPSEFGYVVDQGDVVKVRFTLKNAKLVDKVTGLEAEI